MADVPDDMWTPFRQLNRVVKTCLSKRAPKDSLAKLELILQKHKPDFVNLLKHSPKNSTCRSEIQKGITDGVKPGLGRTILSKDLVDETIILSDMFDLNEYKALQLLCTAQQQMPHHPGLPLGLVAILLYYDGQKTLIATLKQLFQARHGISWCTEAPQDIAAFVKNYTDALVADGLLNKMIDLLEQLDVTQEFALLSKNRALGPPKHHRQVLDFFEEIRVQLATTLYCWAAQSGLPRSTALKLIQHLSKYTTDDPRSEIDEVTLALIMALVYAFDLSVLKKRDYGENIVLELPIVKDSAYITDVYAALTVDWKSNELRSVGLFSFALMIATLRQTPQNLQQNASDLIDQHEVLAETAIQEKVFDYIYHVLLEKSTVFQTEFYFRRIHFLLTDFIEFMHSKVNELRARADETARTIQIHQQQGLDPPPNLCRHFETLLLIVGKLYSNDKMNLNLDLEYWGPMETSGNYQQQRTSNRSLSLLKFIHLAGKLLPPNLLIPNLKMLAGLSSCQQSARKAFNLLKGESTTSGSISILSWEYFFGLLSCYDKKLREEQNLSVDTFCYGRSVILKEQSKELVGLQAILAVIRSVATHDEEARITLCEHLLQRLLDLVSYSVPISLKADLLLTLAAFAKSKEIAIQLWPMLEASQIIATIPSTNGLPTVPLLIIENDIEQTENRNATYPLTQAILKLLYSLFTSTMPRNLGAESRIAGVKPYFDFILGKIFLKLHHRFYKNESEKWIIAEKCLEIFDFFVKSYEIDPADFILTERTREGYPPPGFYIMLKMNTNENSELLKFLLHIIDEAWSAPNTFAGKARLVNCVLYALHIIERSLMQQDRFFEAHHEAKCSILLSGLKKLLLGIDYCGGKPDHMLNIMKYVTYNSWLPKQALLAVRILSHVTRQPGVHTLLLSEFTRTNKLASEIRHGFVECLEFDLPTFVDTEDIKGAFENGDEIELTIKEEIIELLEECLSHSAPNVSHYLLGFDITQDIRATFNQQLAVLNLSSNCTKALFTLLEKGVQQLKYGIETSIHQRRLIQSSWRLLCALYSNDETHEIWQFLRECGDVLSDRMQHSRSEDSKPMQTTHEVSAVAKKQQHICHACGKVFPRKDNLKRHLLSHETQREKFICFCGTECVSKQVHIKHWKRKHQNLKYQDPVKDLCDKRENQKLYSCDYCKKGFQRKNNLKRHMRTHGYMVKGVNRCNFCLKTYSNVWNLDTHIKTLHSENVKFMEYLQLSPKSSKKERTRLIWKKSHCQLPKLRPKKTNGNVRLSYSIDDKTCKSLNDEWRENFRIENSNIEGLGLFANRQFRKNQPLISYEGEIISNKLADLRELQYKQKKMKNYLFRMDDKTVIDATMKGNAARFINHSCDPNSRAVLINSAILIFSKKNIKKGEEITYDYFLEPADEKEKCLCRAKNCKKYL